MKTWETYSRERFESGVAAGRKMAREELREENRKKGWKEGWKEGRKEFAREVMDFLDRQPPGEGVDALYDFLSKIVKNGGKSRRPRD